MASLWGGAFLNGAHLNNANLWGADLSGANLCGAELGGTKLSGANLRAPDFTAVRTYGTIFADVDLSAAKGLETIQHDGPSTVGIDTIYKSHGNIPEVSLRGHGFPGLGDRTRKTLPRKSHYKRRNIHPLQAVGSKNNSID